MRDRVTVLAVLAFALLSATAHGQTFSYVPWVAPESFLGGKQSDARLDKPISLWQAGIPLEKVFSSIAQQTGVVVDVDAADFENQRVRVNLFLNEEHPPTLRDLMVQLSWAVDCSFGVTDESGLKTYRLMATRMSSRAEQALREHLQEKIAAREPVWKAMDDRVIECREALMLSREDMVSRYRGKNDQLLLSLLDPVRRAGLTYLCRHVSESLRPPDSVALGPADTVAFANPVRPSDFTAQDAEDLHVGLRSAKGPPVHRASRSQYLRFLRRAGLP